MTQRSLSFAQMEPGDRFSRLLESVVTPTKYIQPHRDDITPAIWVRKKEGKCPRGSYNKAMPVLSAAHH